MNLGSSPAKITIHFNHLSGLGHRPIAHTCDYTLELPVSYANFDDFQCDFDAILHATKEEFTWAIDAI